MYEVLRKSRIHNLSIKCQLDMIDKIVRGGTTRWCRVQNLTCCSTGSRHQYIVI
jgi:hypothetical protein